MDVYRDILEIVKATVRAQNLTIRELSKRLRVSEPTIKRWLKGKGLSLQQWLRLLECINLSFSDIAAAAKDPGQGQFEYTTKQEEVLARTPGLLAFFQALLTGKKPLEIGKVHGLTRRSVGYYLKALDAADLIEWREGFLCRLKKTGEPTWRKDGPLATTFRDHIFRKFIEPRRRKGFQIGIYELSEEDAKEISDETKKIYSRAKALEKKTRLLRLKARPYCIVFASDGYAPDFLYQIPNKT